MSRAMEVNMKIMIAIAAVGVALCAATAASAGPCGSPCYRRVTERQLVGYRDVVVRKPVYRSRTRFVPDQAPAEPVCRRPAPPPCGQNPCGQGFPAAGQQWTFRGKPPGSARHPLCEGHRPGEQFQLPNGQMGMCD